MGKSILSYFILGMEDPQLTSQFKTWSKAIKNVPLKRSVSFMSCFRSLSFNKVCPKNEKYEPLNTQWVPFTTHKQFNNTLQVRNISTSEAIIVPVTNPSPDLIFTFYFRCISCKDNFDPVQTASTKFNNLRNNNKKKARLGNICKRFVKKFVAATVLYLSFVYK